MNPLFAGVRCSFPRKDAEEPAYPVGTRAIEEVRPSVEAGLAGNERPRPASSRPPGAQEKLNRSGEFVASLRALVGEQATPLFEERALLARARLARCRPLRGMNRRLVTASLAADAAAIRPRRRCPGARGLTEKAPMRCQAPAGPRSSSTSTSTPSRRRRREMQLGREKRCQVPADDLRRRPPERLRVQLGVLLAERERMKRGVSPSTAARAGRAERLGLDVVPAAAAIASAAASACWVASPPCLIGKSAASPAAKTSSRPRTRWCSSTAMKPLRS